MDCYKIGDISSLLNASSTNAMPAAASKLFDTAPTVSVEEVYAKPVPITKTKGKRPKKTKAIPDPPIVTAPEFPQLSAEEQLEIDRRTLFVGNLPIGLKKKELRKLFDDCGKIESLRFRSVAIADLKLGRKACLKSGKVNENATNKNAYIVFADKECLEPACSKNATLINDHYIRVDKVIKSKKDVTDDNQKSIFVGNIPFSASEEDIRVGLQQCGDIEYVRLLRDAATNIGKGFGYVKFADSSGVQFAMKVKDSIEVGGRKLRIQKCKSKITLENTKKAKEAKAKLKNKKARITERSTSFRGRKSKGTDKNEFAEKKVRSRPNPKNAHGKPQHTKPKTLSKKKFDKKVNKVSKKSQSNSNSGKRSKMVKEV